MKRTSRGSLIQFYSSIGLLAAFLVTGCNDSTPSIPQIPNEPEFSCEPGRYQFPEDQEACAPCPDVHFCLGGLEPARPHICEAEHFIESYSAIADERVCTAMQVCGDGTFALENPLRDGTSLVDEVCCETIIRAFDNPLVIRSASDVPASEYSCIYLEGDLHIEADSMPVLPFAIVTGVVDVRSYAGSDLTFLQSMRRTTVLKLANAPGITDLDGLTALEHAFGFEFRLENLNDITRLSSIENINALSFYGTNNLRSFEGVEHIVEMDSNLYIEDITSTETLDLSAFRNL